MVQCASILALLLLSKQLVHTQQLRPTCLEVFEDYENNGCARIMPGSEGSMNWKLQRILAVQGINDSNLVYTNVTVIFMTRADIERLAIKRVDGSTRTKWILEPVNHSKSIFPMFLKIAYIPYPINETRILKYSTKPNSEFVCQQDQARSDCKNLFVSELILSDIPDRNELIFYVKNAREHIVKGVFVELLSSNCSSLNCGIATNNCTNLETNVSHHNLRNTTVKITFERNDHIYYCVRVKQGQECCSYNTDTKDFKRSSLEEAKNSLYMSDVVIYRYIFPFAAILLIICLGSFVISQLNGRFCHRSPNSFDIDRLLSYSHDTEMNNNPCIGSNIEEILPLEVLLLYPKESDDFQNLMDSFRNVLKLYVNKVWDPHDEDIIEMVHENWWQWLENVLKISKLKVIVVETEKTRDWWASDFRKDTLPCHYLEGIFYFAVSRIREDQTLCTDYSRLFRIRFDMKIANPESRLNIIVPCTCYIMPQHLSHLLKELLGCTSFALRKRSDIGHEEIDVFEEALNKYRGNC